MKNKNIFEFVLILALFAMFGCTQNDKFSPLVGPNPNITITVYNNFSKENLVNNSVNNFTNIKMSDLEKNITNNVSFANNSCNENQSFVWLRYPDSNETEIINESDLTITFDPYYNYDPGSFDILGDKWEFFSTWSRENWYPPYYTYNISNKSFVLGKRITLGFAYLNETINNANLILQNFDENNEVAFFVSDKDNKTLSISPGEIKELNNSYIYIQLGSSYSGRRFLAYSIFLEVITLDEVNYSLITDTHNRTQIKSITIPKTSPAIAKINKNQSISCNNNAQRFLWLNYMNNWSETQILNESGLTIRFSPSAPVGEYIDISGDKWMIQYVTSEPNNWSNVSFVLGKAIYEENRFILNQAIKGTDLVIKEASTGTATLVSNNTNKSYTVQSNRIAKIGDKYLYPYINPFINNPGILEDYGYYYVFSEAINFSEIQANVEDTQYNRNIKSIFIPRNSLAFARIFNNSR